MEIFDTHMHISGETPNEEIIRSAHAANVKYMLVCGGSAADSREAADFAAMDENIFFAAGIHPHECAAFNGDTDFLYDLAERPRFKAVGEIGLDTFYDLAPFGTQVETFEKMLVSALDLNVPAVIHCRAKENEDEPYRICFEKLSAFAGKGGRFVMHCYAGNGEFLEKFKDTGAYFGVGGMLTFKRSDNIRENTLKIPRERLLLETDSPYLAPVPFRGKENIPAYLPEVAGYLASMLETDIDSVAKLTTENAFRFFGINKKGESVHHG